MQNNIRTIDIILNKYGYTKEYLLECRKKGITNGMGGKGGIQFTDLIRHIDYFNIDKLNILLDDLDLLSDIHDLDFAKGGGIKEFIKANYEFSIGLMQILHWTSIKSRGIIFLVAFMGLNIFGIRYFKWTKIF